MLARYLTNEVIKINVSVSNWKKAIEEAGKLLVNSGSVRPKYINAMIKLCEENNAYIVVAPGIALAHARPEQGANQTSFSILTLKKPVCFGHPENDPVDLVIAFAATGGKHMKVLKQLANLLSDGKTVKKIRKAETVDEILKAVENVSKS